LFLNPSPQAKLIGDCAAKSIEPSRPANEQSWPLEYRLHAYT
jgi:hypothetical protein